MCMNILLVDRDPVMRSGYACAAAGLGHKLLAAVDMEQAMDVLRNIPTDLVVVGSAAEGAGEGEEGAEGAIAERMRRLQAGVRVAFVPPPAAARLRRTPVDYAAYQRLRDVILRLAGGPAVGLA